MTKRENPNQIICYTLQGMLYRSQLSNVTRVPIQLPVLPQIHYQQFCQQKAVHNGDDEDSVIGGLVVERVNIPPYEPTIQLNQRRLIPPIKRTLKPKVRHLHTQHDVYDSDNSSNMHIHVKWNDTCKCMRCKLMKTDFEVGGKDQYAHWGHYPCVPDAIINREEQDSSDGEQ